MILIVICNHSPPHKAGQVTMHGRPLDEVQAQEPVGLRHI